MMFLLMLLLLLVERTTVNTNNVSLQNTLIFVYKKTQNIWSQIQIIDLDTYQSGILNNINNSIESYSYSPPKSPGDELYDIDIHKRYYYIWNNKWNNK